MIVLTTAFALLASGAAAPALKTEQPPLQPLALQPLEDAEEVLLMEETEALDSDEFVFGEDLSDDSLVDIEE